MPICQGRFDDPPPPEEDEKVLDAVKVLLDRQWRDDRIMRPDDRAEDRMALEAAGVMLQNYYEFDEK